MGENKINSEGIGFTGLLTLMFIYLKLTEKINWDWKWVLSPILIPILIVLTFVFLVMFFAVLFEIGKATKRRKKK